MAFEGTYDPALQLLVPMEGGQFRVLTGLRQPDGSLVAAMYNSGAANNAYVVSIGGKKLQFAMPASGWATVKFAP